MKAVVIASMLVVLLQLGAAEERQFVFKEEEFTPDEDQCIAELNINKNELEAAIKQITNYLPEDNLAFTRFLACFWKKAKFQEENGAIIYDNIIKLVEAFPRFKFGSDSADPVGHEVAVQAVASCQNIPLNNNHGQVAAKVQNCVTKHIVEAIK